ncbi:TetR/AcrR family transcriptional regulator [Amycolatopsis sp. NPDC051903]|uniref:TetR/AcrR family transcriptional regulator n=1 Tax=Amycolatopsis sp. NPDC051903 TaxID=3363936 RepID=UPI00378B65B2
MATQARQRLLDTAAELFYAEGIRAVGVERILAESGVGRASFYRHFASKDELVIEVLRRTDTAWRDWLATRVDTLTDTAGDKPLAVFDALEERFGRQDFRGCAFINTIVETADPSSLAHHVAHEHKEAVIDYLAGLLEAAGHPAPRPMAQALHLLIDGAVVTALRERTPDPARRAKESAAVLLAAAGPAR